MYYLLMEYDEAPSSEQLDSESEDDIALTPIGEQVRADLRKAEREWTKVSEQMEELERRQSELAEEQAALKRQHADLEMQVLLVKTKVETLRPFYERLEEEARENRAREWEQCEQAGIQECCYRVLLESKEPLEALNIRFELKELGIAIEKYANPLAVIHTSLKRIPDRVRSFKVTRTDPLTMKRGTVRMYEAIRTPGPKPAPANGLCPNTNIQ